jgi:Holliday junction DNA helicase RuvA
MIALVSGTVVATGSDYVIIDTNGVGYLVHLPKPTLSAVNDGDAVRFFTSLIVREDSLTLYGFANWAQRLLFDQLLAVSGISTKVAMSLLSRLSPDDLKTAFGQAVMWYASAKCPASAANLPNAWCLSSKAKSTPAVDA